MNNISKYWVYVFIGNLINFLLILLPNNFLPWATAVILQNICNFQ